MQPATQPVSTFDELYRQLRWLPNHLRGEILHGRLITSPRPAIRHASVNTTIIYDLAGPFHRRAGGPKGPGGWWILPEPELRLQLPGETAILAPDLAGWTHERVPYLPDVAHMTLAPDWVCEVLSPSTARYDRKDKGEAYLYAGVTWYWLVDPRVRTLEVYRREGVHWMQMGIWQEDDRVRAEPFDAVELDLGVWWEAMGPEEAE